MDPMVGQKLIEMSVNINDLNVKVLQLQQQVAALMDVASAQARHWHRAQGTQGAAPGVQGQPPFGSPGPGFDGS